ncbi:unnamed protein product [Rhizoctonia solani]|uniref:Uncharacterized protein n=1 Tax=Rhizoctonia solani TaxID=456999 RepID=A0A8H3AX89_9AGAM|nr:unnamed protein product [Rhizoctonia solani]
MPEEESYIHRRYKTVLALVKELYNEAFGKCNNADLEELTRLAKNAMEEKRAASGSVPTEPRLEEFAWRCRVVELAIANFLEISKVLTDSTSNETSNTELDEWCQLALHLYRELKKTLENYISDNPGTLLPENSPSVPPEIELEQLMSYLSQTLFQDYTQALKEFMALVTDAMTELETFNLKTEISAILARDLFYFRRRQFATRDQAGHMAHEPNPRKSHPPANLFPRLIMI